MIITPKSTIVKFRNKFDEEVFRSFRGALLEDLFTFNYSRFILNYNSSFKNIF